MRNIWFLAILVALPSMGLEAQWQIHSKKKTTEAVKVASESAPVALAGIADPNMQLNENPQALEAGVFFNNVALTGPSSLQPSLDSDLTKLPAHKLRGPATQSK